MLTDRDIVVRCVAEGGTRRRCDWAPWLTDPVTVGAGDTIEVVSSTMSEHAVRRLPDIDGHDLVGIVAHIDAALDIDESRIGGRLASISD